MMRSRHTRRMLLAALVLALLLLAPLWVLAQPSIDLSWWTADSGDVGQGGEFYLRGYVGQPDAGVLHGGEYVLSGGFEGGKTPPTSGTYTLYLPRITVQE